jgi:hypothetical protein
MIEPARPRAAPARIAVTLLLAVGSAGAAGCGGAAAPGRPAPSEAKVKVAASKVAASKVAASKVAARPQPGPARPRSVVARIDASSDRIVAEGKFHIASGAPSDAEIRREIAAARKAGIVLPSGDSAASFENSPSNSGGVAVEAETPETAWNPRSKPIADWIIPILEWAHLHRWTGTVTSGYRTFFEQAQLNAAGAFSAKAGLSNHETTRYPGGAVDVTSPSQLITVLRAYPGPVKLVGGVLGPIDPEHFSATGD